MLPIDSFPHLLNEIFGKVKAETSIVISFILPSADVAGPGSSFPKLTGVNGFSSTDDFWDYLQSARANLVAKVVASMAEMDHQDKRIFLRQMIDRCYRYSLVTIPFAIQDKSGGSVSHQHTHWVFYHPKFDPGEGACPDMAMQQYLIKRTRNYALLWRLAGEQLLAELHSLFYLVEFLPVISQPAALPPAHEKITVRMSQPELAATFRLLHESHLISLRNKTKLCQVVSECFSTHNKRDLSASNLKNHFDAPTPEVLDRVYAAFGKMRQNPPKTKFF